MELRDKASGKLVYIVCWPTSLEHSQCQLCHTQHKNWHNWFNSWGHRRCDISACNKHPLNVSVIT